MNSVSDFGILSAKIIRYRMPPILLKLISKPRGFEVWLDRKGLRSKNFHPTMWNSRIPHHSHNWSFELPRSSIYWPNLWSHFSQHSTSHPPICYIILSRRRITNSMEPATCHNPSEPDFGFVFHVFDPYPSSYLPGVWSRSVLLSPGCLIPFPCLPWLVNGVAPDLITLVLFLSHRCLIPLPSRD